MDLQELEQHWHAFGEQDPLWAILSAPGKRGGAWNLDEFFATGRSEVGDVLDGLAKRGIEVARGRVLDFGCGVGRLTQALSDYFTRCDGVDVAESMIERARRLNRRSDRVHFHHNEAVDLALFEDESFDFVLSLLVLQHMEPQLMRGYVSEFLRVLRSDGIAYFNIPERIVVPDALPDPALQAEISVAGALPAFVAGEVVRLPLQIKNVSPLPWPPSAQIEAGNHWVAADGTMLTFDDGRTPLDRVLLPGDECEVPLEVTVPASLGSYRLEVDLVQQWVTWFGDRGSTILRLPIAVTESASPQVGSAAPGSEASFTPTMEMHSLSRSEVETIVREAGGTLLEAVPSPHSGPAHPTVDYIVTRSQQSAALPSGTPHTPTRRGSDAALQAMGSRADLLAFGLTSRSRRWGALSVTLRELVRRILFQVLHRQSEFNRASTEWATSAQAQLDQLSRTLEQQRGLIAALRDRVAELEQRASDHSRDR